MAGARVFVSNCANHSRARLPANKSHPEPAPRKLLDEESHSIRFILLHLYVYFGDVLRGIDPSGSVMLDVSIVAFPMR